MERFRILDHQELNEQAQRARVMRKWKGEAEATKLKGYAVQTRA